MPPRTDPRAGFLLVEVLAALAVTAALVAAVLPFAGQLIGRWQAGQASVIQADAWMRAVARLTDDVAEALPVHDPGGATPALAFSVEPRRIELVRPALGQIDAVGLERVSYQVLEGAGGETLVRRARPLAGGTDEGGASTITMLEGPYTFRFSATGKDGLRTTSWTAGAALPLRLDLLVTSRAGGPMPFSPVALPIPARSSMAVTVPLLRTAGP